MTIEYNFSGIDVVIIAILAIVFLILTVAGFNRLRQIFIRPDLYGMGKEEIKRRWNEIRSLLDKNSEIQFKMALMEADKLFDQVLKSLNYPGSTFGQRLRFACHKNPRLKDIWSAHFIRNKLVHETDYRLSYGSAKRALEAFETGLKELGVL